MPIHGLAGYGARLEARLGPYNVVEDKAITQLASEVIDRGILRGADETGDEIVIHLDRPIHVSSEHTLLVWKVDGSVDRLKNPHFLNDTALCFRYANQTDLVGLALFYKGARLGAYLFKYVWSKYVSSIKDEKHVVEVT